MGRAVGVDSVHMGLDSFPAHDLSFLNVEF